MSVYTYMADLVQSIPKLNYSLAIVTASTMDACSMFPFCYPSTCIYI